MKKIALGATVGLGAVAVPATFAGTASAADMTKWNCIASYESGNSDGLDDGVWDLATGDADSTGGLQIQDRTWNEFKAGISTADHAYQATKDQQIAVAEKILAAQGPGAWTTASRCDGVGSWDGTPTVTTTTPPPSTPPADETPAPSGTLDPITGATVPKPKDGSPADLAVKYAINAISAGLPYVYGGNGPQDGGWDCSGLTSQAWKAAGVDFTESARDSYSQEELPSIVPGATAVNSIKDLLPGDLVTYDGFEGGHVAMYVGPIGPNGEDLIETNSRHPQGGVNWSFMDERSGRGPSARTAMVRPAPFVPATGTVTPPPSGGGDTTPPPADGGGTTQPPSDGGGTTTPPPSDGGGTTTPPSDGGGTVTPPPATDGTYTVVVGDYLDKIAREHNVPGGWPALYAANRDVVGDNPDLIFPGQVLKLPTGSVAHHHHRGHHHWNHHHNWK